jgi:uncharacterized repeat protein (TIGR04052 family)
MTKIGYGIRLIALVIITLSIGIVSAQHDSGGAMTMTDDGTTTIRFAARVGNKDAACGITYSGLGSAASDLEITDFRVYISNLNMVNSDGELVPIQLTQDGLWQTENVALLDFEDGSARCGEFGNASMNTKILGEIPEGDFEAIVFDVGVPFELNHLDTTTAASPLNIPAMWWGWQFGYKFAKIDMMADSESWLLHLGSTGCVAPDFTTPPEEPCANPNLIQVRLDAFDPATDFIVIDLAALLDGIDLSESVPEPPGCMSGTDDADCTAIFPNLALNLETGLCVDGDCSTQKMFSIQ